MSVLITRRCSAYVLLTAAFLLLCTAPTWAQDASPQTAASRERAQTLRGRLQRGEAVRLVAFGDSLTAGWGTDGRQVYYRLVADTLQFAFPQCHLEVVERGHPGETTDGALGRFDAEVRAEQPDLLLVQFGGNDKGWGRPVGDFRRDLGLLLKRSCEETAALVVACLPPIVDPNPANEWNETARAVAATAGVPTADLDRAIRQGDGDCRGPFPYTSHPASFTHAIMAREVLRALREALGVTQAPTCHLEGGSRLSAQSSYDLGITVSNPSEAPLDEAVQVEWQDKLVDSAVHVAPGETAHSGQKLTLPPFTGLSYSFPVRLLGRGGSFGDFAVRWLTVAPAIRADTDDTLSWHSLGADSLTLGRGLWLGAKDLSARFAAVVSPEQLAFVVEVTDNAVTVAADNPHEGDSVELYLDLRPAAEQGKPVYGPEVVALQIPAPTGPAGTIDWRSMQTLPEALKGLKVQGRRTPGGYRVRVELPLAAVTALRGGTWSGLGFDVAVNDADGGGPRKTQMMWTGFPDNYLNPGYLAGLYAEALPPGATRQTLW